MAVSYTVRLNENVVANTSTGEGSGDYTSSGFATSEGTLLVLVISHDEQSGVLNVADIISRGANPTTAGITWTSWTDASYIDFSNWTAGVSVWIADSPGAGTGRTITQNPPDAWSDWDSHVNSIDVTVLEFAGAADAAAHLSGLAVAGYVYSASGSARDPGALSVTANSTPRPDSMMVTTFAGDGGTAGTPGTGFTELADRVESGNRFLKTHLQIREGSSTSTEVGWVGGDTAVSGGVYDYTVSYFEVMSAPNVIATDDFNRADGDLGSNWTSPSTMPVIVSNSVSASSALTAYDAHWSAASFDGDQWVQADVTVNDLGTLTRGRLTLCDEVYEIEWEGNASTVELSKSGAVQASTSLAFGTSTLRMEKVGGRITVYAGGVEILSWTDSSPVTTGSPGLGLYRAGASSSVTIDNFSAGDWTDPAGTLRFYPADNYGTTSGTSTVSNMSWNTGDIIVVMSGQGSDANTALVSNLPTNANLTFTNLDVVDASGNNSDARFDYAIAGSAQTFQTISQTTNDNSHTGTVAWVYTPLSPGSAIIRTVYPYGSIVEYGDNTTQTLNVAEGSIVLYGMVDWNADTTTQTLATGSGTPTKRADSYNAGTWGWVFGDWVGTTAGATAFGLTSYAGLAASQMFVEISERTIVATDDFNRANGAVGSNWTAALNESISLIASNVLQGDASTGNTSYWSADTFDNDQWAEADATLGTVYSEVHVDVRSSGSGRYMFAWTTDASGTYDIIYYNGSTFTSIATAKTGVGTTGTRKLRVEVVGTTITGYVDGVEQVTATNSGLTSGSPGLGQYRDNNTGGTLDNFSAGDWTDRTVDFYVGDALDYGDTSLDFSPDPATGDILITAISESSASGAPANPDISDNMGGLWNMEATHSWASRRKTTVWVKDDWTSASPTETITYSGDQDKVSVGIVVKGAQSAATYEVYESSGSASDFTPTLTQCGAQDLHIMFLFFENANQANITSPPDGWLKVGDYLTGGSGVRVASVWVHWGTLSDTTPTFNWWNAGGYSAWIGKFEPAGSGGGASPQTWTGNAASIQVAATSGSFTGAATWTGSAASIQVVASSGDFLNSLVPSNLVATAVDGDTISLTWDAVTDATGYDIERDGSVIVSDHPTNSYTDNGLSASTSYTYRVRSAGDWA